MEEKLLDFRVRFMVSAIKTCRIIRGVVEISQICKIREKIYKSIRFVPVSPTGFVS